MAPNDPAGPSGTRRLTTLLPRSSQPRKACTQRRIPPLPGQLPEVRRPACGDAGSCSLEALGRLRHREVLSDKKTPPATLQNELPAFGQVLKRVPVSRPTRPSAFAQRAARSRGLQTPACLAARPPRPTVVVGAGRVNGAPRLRPRLARPRRGAYLVWGGGPRLPGA